MAVQFERFLRALALAAGVACWRLMLFTVADVILRYLFNAPFRSVFEFTEFTMALIVFLAIPYTGWTGGHIAVDVFERWLNRPSLRFLPALLAFMGAILFAVIAYRTAAGNPRHLRPVQQPPALAALPVPLHRRLRLRACSRSSCLLKPSGRCAGPQPRNPE